MINYFRLKLLQQPNRVMNNRGEIIEIYNQPERSKREDFKSYNDYELDCGCHAEPGFFSRYVNCNLDHENLIP